MTRTHFWIPEPAPEVERWDPDSDPQRYATGVGHNLYELYARLRAAGEPASIGRVQPDDGVVVAFAKSLRPLSAQYALLRGLGSKPLILIRSDVDPAWHPRFTPDVEVMPYGSAVTSPSQIWLPALPQRGMIRRSAERFGRISTVGFKGNPENLPSFMRDPEWVLNLDALGLEWLADAPELGGGSDQRWHDFAKVDVAVCLRAEDVHRRSWKPATKLVNAWCAGAIPLVGPEPAYLDLVRPHEDAFVVETEAEVIAALKQLRRERLTVQSMEAAIKRRAKDFTPAAVLDQWRDLLRKTSEAPMTANVLRGRYRRARWLFVLTRLNSLRRR